MHIYLNNFFNLIVMNIISNNDDIKIKIICGKRVIDKLFNNILFVIYSFNNTRMIASNMEYMCLLTLNIVLVVSNIKYIPMIIKIRKSNIH